ncbi:hypothetical protein YC2023_026683 [Brassica napus]
MVKILFKDSNESGLHYWNFVLDNGYAIGRTRNRAVSQGCTTARAGDNVAIALQGIDANQVSLHYPVCVETFSESRALGRVRPARPRSR